MKFNFTDPAGEPVKYAVIAGDTILIDDAERSLHPTWCCKIIRILRKEPHVKQLIVATNANDLWDDGMSWERHHLGWR